MVYQSGCRWQYPASFQIRKVAGLAEVSIRSRLQASSFDRALQRFTYSFQIPTIPSIYMDTTTFISMTLIVMESPPVIGSPAIAHLCDVVLETLRSFVDAADDIKAFCGEVLTLRKFLSLIDRVFKAKLPRMAFEEQHFTSLEVLLDRCRTTLSRLCEILTALGPNLRQASAKNDLQEAPRSLQSSEMIALRARIGFYVQTLQMSLLTIKL